jgi:hypothetical protein
MKFFKKLVVATMAVCLLGMQVPSALADCASDLNTCETIAANNFNNCVDNAFNTYGNCVISCGGNSTCEAACQQSLEDQLQVCLNSYYAAYTRCQAIYKKCITPITG